jgi:hypothetical protein
MSSEQLVSSLDGRLVLKFTWQGDRYCQQLSVDGNVVGDSIESDAEQAWPTSPPIQQISLEQIDGRKMILGVGAAGRSHWSISVGPCPGHDNALKFDLACRCKEPPVFLGSSYRIAAPLVLSAVEGRLNCEGTIRQVVADPADDATRRWSYRLAGGP